MNLADANQDSEFYEGALDALPEPRRNAGLCILSRLVDYLSLNLDERMHDEAMSGLSRSLQVQGERGAEIPTRAYIPGLCHSIVQQILREDPLVFLAMVACQPEPEWHLISSPRPALLQWNLDAAGPPSRTGLYLRLEEPNPVIELMTVAREVSVRTVFVSTFYILFATCVPGIRTTI